MCMHAELCLTFDHPMNCRLPVSSVPGIFRQEYCSGLPFPTPGDLPPETKSMSLKSPALASGLFTTDSPGKPIKSLTAAAKSLQSCLTLCDPIDGSPPGSPVPRVLQARTLEWIAISFSNVWKWSHSIMYNSQWPHGLQPTRLPRPWDSPGKNTGVGCHFLL